MSIQIIILINGIFIHPFSLMDCINIYYILYIEDLYTPSLRKGI